MKLVAIFDSPAPYTTPVLNALATQLDLHCIYLADKDQVGRFDDSWGVEPDFEHTVSWVKRFDLPSVDFQVEFSLGVARLLRALEPDAVLLVSWKPAVVEPLLWSRWSGAAAVMWAESTSFSGLLREPVSTRIRRWMTRAFDGYVSNGSQATSYLRELGVPPDRIVTSILPAGRAPRTTDRAESAPPGVRFLFVGRLVPRKRPLELIAAFETVRAAVPDATLTVVGGGELEPEVSEAARRVPGVEYLGHKEGAELAAVYSRSDILVLPALREVWGVVVNEAVSHGLYVIATDQVGSAYDLLDDETGLVIGANDLGRLAPSLIEAAGSVDFSNAGRRRRASVMTRCTPERFATDITRAVEAALRVRAERRRRPRRAATR